jgi:hypothetical protein
MPRLKLTAVAVAAALACLPAAPALAGPWLVPWAVGHAIGAAVRLATLPIIAAGQPPPPVTPAPYWTGYAAPPLRYSSAGYYGPPAYYASPPAYYVPSVGYYGGPQRYYPAFARRIPVPYARSAPLPQPLSRYSASGMRYSGLYGGALFGRTRGFTYRRW